MALLSGTYRADGGPRLDGLQAKPPGPRPGWSPWARRFPCTVPRWMGRRSAGRSAAGVFLSAPGGDPGQRAAQRAREVLVDRVREAHVRNDAIVIEKRVDAIPRTVDELVDHDHVARMDVLAHRTDRRHAENLLGACHLQGEHVGSVVDAMRGDAMKSWNE